VTARLLKDLGCADENALWRKLHVDRPVWVGPVCKLKHHPDDPKADLWGVRYRSIDYGTGEYGEASYYPLAKFETVEQVERYRWPQVEDYDFSGVAKQAAGLDGTRIVNGGGYEPFLLYCNLRGMEQAYEDLLLAPELAEAILTKIFDFHFACNVKLWQEGRGKIDMMYLAEDLAGQTGPLFSMDTYRRFLLPNQKKMAAKAKEFGLRVFYHTDGAARVFLPTLIDEVGIDVLNPIQWRCPGMEREGLVRDFGSKVVFHSAIDNQQTLPFGTPEDVAREVTEAAAIFGAARWICGPCHNLQPVSPTANIVALYETIHRIGKKA
jgi:uroporphyrinogen decarboxylase